MADSIGEVYVLKTTNRKQGVPALIDKMGLNSYSGAAVALKANYNSADPFPASTHIDTLRAIIESIKKTEAKSITLAERSGMGYTNQVFNRTGVLELSKELGFNTVVLDNAAKEDWIKCERKDTHWITGFFMARLFHDADKIIQTCCLKTHRFGGDFTMSLKNSVGLIAKKVPGSMFDYMWELHSSPFQRKMIAEINLRYNLDFVIMDAVKAFITGGPEKGAVVEPNLMLASHDRVAIDAVGVAILKMHGAKGKVGELGVFEQDQIKRAAELCFGVRSASEIQLVPINSESQPDVERIEKIFCEQGTTL